MLSQFECKRFPARCERHSKIEKRFTQRKAYEETRWKSLRETIRFKESFLGFPFVKEVVCTLDYLSAYYSGVQRKASQALESET